MLLLCAGDYRVFAAPQPPGAQDIELADGWTLKSATGMNADGAAVSVAGYDDADRTPVRRMPTTVLEALQDAGVYPNLYYGKNLLTGVPQDLYKQDWWYRTSFTAPADFQTYRLDFGYQLPRGHLAQRPPHRRQPSDRRDVQRPRTRRHTVDRQGRQQRPGGQGDPERAIQDVDGVELADSWYDWINWRYLGYQGPGKNPANGNLSVLDRNAGIFKPVRLRAFGPVDIGPSSVNTELPLPDTDTALFDRLFQRAQLHRSAGEGGCARDDQQGRQRHRPGGATGFTAAAREPRNHLQPHEFANSPSTIRICGGPTRWANPTCMTYGWTSSRTAPPPAPGPEVRHPHRHPGPRLRRHRACRTAAGTSTSRSTDATSWSAEPRTRPICCTGTTRTATGRSCGTPRTSA